MQPSAEEMQPSADEMQPSADAAPADGATADDDDLVVRALLETMKAHRDSCAVQEAACSALTTLFYTANGADAAGRARGVLGRLLGVELLLKEALGAFATTASVARGAEGAALRAHAEAALANLRASEKASVL
eukprot:3533592-Prymnesium_polylepis.1